MAELAPVAVGELADAVSVLGNHEVLYSSLLPGSEKLRAVERLVFAELIVPVHRKE